VAVRIRLMRMGKRNRPYYRIVVADSRSSRDGKYIEALGGYDPINPPHVRIDEEKALEWIRKGAEISDSARKLLSKHGILKRLQESRVKLKSGEGGGNVDA
jgi:small subunit ribosomal protein S16